MRELAEYQVRECVRAFFEGRNRFWIEPESELLARVASQEVIAECSMMRRQWNSVGEERGIKYVSSISDCGVGQIQWVSSGWDEAEVQVLDKTRWLYQEGSELYDEERRHRGILRVQHDVLSGNYKVKDIYWMGESARQRPQLQVETEKLPDLKIDSWRMPYNRLKAYQYAELYWHHANPAYRRFEDDCTNFISQVIAAGGFPMEWSNSKSRGWWYRHTGGKGDSWSYSWAVAHSFKMYLQQHKNVTAVDDPRQLEIGDVICYDWNGDGHWQHNTVVVGYERRGYPLVNAHTVDSRNRYFSYQDSHAFTSNTQYAFFHITL